MEGKVAATRFFALGREIFQAWFQFARPTGFPAFSNQLPTAANHSVHIAMAITVPLLQRRRIPEDHQQPPTSRDLAVRYRAKPRAPPLHRCRLLTVYSPTHYQCAVRWP